MVLEVGGHKSTDNAPWEEEKWTFFKRVCYVFLTKMTWKKWNEMRNLRVSLVKYSLEMFFAPVCPVACNNNGVYFLVPRRHQKFWFLTFCQIYFSMATVSPCLNHTSLCLYTVKDELLPSCYNVMFIYYLAGGLKNGRAKHRGELKNQSTIRVFGRPSFFALNWMRNQCFFLFQKMKIHSRNHVRNESSRKKKQGIQRFLV